MAAVRPLQKILGLGFGLAFAFGTMVGIGILHLPGMVVAAAKRHTHRPLLVHRRSLYAHGRRVAVGMIMGPRVLFLMARECWSYQRAAAVNRGGTPNVALMATSLTSSAMILAVAFDQLIALFAVLILLYYIAAFLAIFVLRRRLPDAPRPYRAIGYPATTLVVLLGSLAFLAAALIEDWRAGVTALLFLSLCVPAYALAARSRLPEFAPDPR